MSSGDWAWNQAQLTMILTERTEPCCLYISDFVSIWVSCLGQALMLFHFARFVIYVLWTCSMLLPVTRISHEDSLSAVCRGNSSCGCEGVSTTGLRFIL